MVDVITAETHSHNDNNSYYVCHVSTLISLISLIVEIHPIGLSVFTCGCGFEIPQRLETPYREKSAVCLSVCHCHHPKPPPGSDHPCCCTSPSVSFPVGDAGSDETVSVDARRHGDEHYKTATLWVEEGEGPFSLVSPPAVIY